jgi:hypothetical protein
MKELLMSAKLWPKTEEEPGRAIAVAHLPEALDLRATGS